VSEIHNGKNLMAVQALVNAHAPKLIKWSRREMQEPFEATSNPSYARTLGRMPSILRMRDRNGSDGIADHVRRRTNLRDEATDAEHHRRRFSPKADEQCDGHEDQRRGLSGIARGKFRYPAVALSLANTCRAP
jgi:hypothetical protein